MADPQSTQPTDQPDGFTNLLHLLVERATTVSIRVEALGRLLEARGVFTAAEWDQQTADLRTHWALPQHYHPSVSDALTTEQFVARLHQVVVQPADDPTADAS
jgi:hypothetical protein